MPKKIPFELFKEFNSAKELDEWKFSRKATRSIKSSLKSRCTFCLSANHEMRYAYCTVPERSSIFARIRLLFGFYVFLTDFMSLSNIYI